MVFVNGSDLNLWLETSNGQWDMSYTIEFRKPVDANVNDLQPVDSNTIFVMGHDGNLWLETGPFESISQTVATRKPVETNVIVFEALYPSLEVYLIDGDLNLWYESPPYGPSNRLLVDKNVNACFPLYSYPSI